MNFINKISRGNLTNFGSLDVTTDSERNRSGRGKESSKGDSLENVMIEVESQTKGVLCYL